MSSHYENFPVASPLLPRRMRSAVQVLYAFARSADDVADEGVAEPSERIAALQSFAIALDQIEKGVPQTEPLFQQLSHTLTLNGLSTQPLRDLLSAFKQDVLQTRYASYTELLDYCQRSANPVGRLMLALFGEQRPQCLERSDAICTALQLINFLQDVAIDWHKARVYLPQEDLQRFGVQEEQIAEGLPDARWQALMQFEVDRARKLMLSGAPLAKQLPGRLGWELRLIVLGGLRILEKIELAEHDVFHQRPQLNVFDWMIMFWRCGRFVG